MIMRTLVIWAVIVGLLVIIVEGLNGFAIWNLLPVSLVLAAVLTIQWRHRAGKRLRSFVVGFGLATLGVVAFAHLAWYFDWGETATGSSTAGLIFIFIPLWATIFGVASGGLAVLTGVLLERKGNLGA
jgi:hypothetical protein